MSWPRTVRTAAGVDGTGVIAFDADVLIYAAEVGHPLGHRVRALFTSAELADEPAGIGSVLLLPELLSKPMRTRDTRELDALHDLLARIDLLPIDATTARLATALGATYSLRTLDALHLATAIRGGAERFLTKNHRDFTDQISEIDVVYPDDLPAANQ